LIDPVTNSWDENLVRNTFMEMDAEVILATPLREDFEDFYAWQYEENGQFIVKSAYKLYVKLRDGPVQSSSHPEKEEKFWKDIWQLECMPKVKQFVWRLAHNSLPLKKNLERRGLKCDTVCVCCKRLDEDGAHLFVKCKMVKKIWEDLGLAELRHRLWDMQTAKAMMEEILKLEKEQRTLVCCMMWQWWSNRNKVNANEKARAMAEIVSKTRYWTAESLQFCQKERTNSNVLQPVSWQAPEEDRIKINIDASFQAKELTGGWGFVARNYLGEVLGAGAGRISHVASAACAEAQACAAAVRQVAEWGMTRVIIESDAVNLVNAVQTTKHDLAPEGVIYRDIKSFVNLNFESVSFVYSPRVCNKVAHALAALGASGQEACRLWTDVLPNDVMVLVASDLTVPAV
jgi:hypothetical protein